MPSSTSQVRVGVRIRPLTCNEKSLGGKTIVSSCYHNSTVEILKRKFTYDAVFDENVSQSEMYNSVGEGGMLDSFLEGYNTTIIAYGQTGSGKTFTMGSEADYTTMYSPSATDLNTENEGAINDNQGLIPRFMSDIFSSLQYRKQQKRKRTEDKGDTSQQQNQLIDYKVSASFIEVYGDDIHDLLDDNRCTSPEDRKSLPLRKDENGGIVVVGVKSRSIASAEESLQVLHVGTLNRTTAATLMNEVSSRSHAVFTIYLHQTSRQSGDVAGLLSSSSAHEENMDVTTVSRFTFVDLAGSERMKKTGAEGERAREGIEINKGLLALGNVINALADEERLAKGERVHVTYRQAKLTRLLQDALGGNSQTLFLACVSPSDTNGSETISTLQYANRARNIKNAPTKNIDTTVLELQRLFSLNRILEREVVKLRFVDLAATSSGDEEKTNGVDGNEKNDDIGERYDGLLQRKDVQDYLDLLHAQAEEQQEQENELGGPGPGKKILTQAKRRETSSVSVLVPKCGGHTLPTSSLSHRRQSTVEEIDDALMGINPDEDMALLDKLLELQHLDQEFENEHEKDQEQLNQVEGELEEQENLLLQLKASLKAYHNMKERFEKLMVEVQSLESEKASLAIELERVQVDPTKGCSKAIKKRLQTVETSLARARKETRKQQQMYRKAEQDAQKCRILQSKIDQLKHGRVSLIKKQRQASAKHRESTEAKTREIQTLKKKERKTGQKMSKLEAEVVKHKTNLNKRKNYCDKLSEKLKQTETHLMKVLSMRKRDFNERLRKDNSNKNGGNNKLRETVVTGFVPKSEEINSLKFLLEKLVSDKVSYSMLKSRYETRVTDYSELMRRMVNEMSSLQELQNLTKSQEDGNVAKDLELRIHEHKENVEELELKVEVIESEIENIRSRLPNIQTIERGEEQKQLKIEEDTTRMISNLSAPITRTLLMEILENLTMVEIDRSTVKNNLQRKDAALYSSESEVSTLNQRIVGLSKDLKKRNRRLSTINTDEDAYDAIERLRYEKRDLQDTIKTFQSEKEKTEKEFLQAKNKIIAKDIALASLAEKVTVMEVAMKNVDTPALEKIQRTLSQLQSIWDDVGVCLNEREQTRCQLETCLEDTCVRARNNAKAFKEKTQVDINFTLQMIETIHNALGTTDEIQKENNLMSQKFNMTQHLTRLNETRNALVPIYLSAVERRTQIIEESDSIITAMSLPEEKCTDAILSVMKYKQARGKKSRTVHRINTPIHKTAKEKRAKILKDVEKMMHTLESADKMIPREPKSSDDESIDFINSTLKDITDEPGSLSELFLKQCEKDLKELRMWRSETMVSNQLTRNKARILSKEMHLRGRDLISLSIHSVKKRMKDLPEWWNPQVAEKVCRSIIGKDSIIGINNLFTFHLDIVYQSLQSVSLGRESLSKTLKEVLEGAHKTLLTTVEGEIDANDAYAFHGALSRLPPLSKEHIQACIDEIKILIETVDAMAQSEIEALTVVWEALCISSNERGDFWGEVEESTKAFQATTDTSFESVIRNSTKDIEEWVLTSVKDATRIHRQLSARLLKLSKIHEEVEKLRSKQDAKSQIMSLDSEVRILSAKLSEFEEKAGSRQRLTKKMNSSTLLKEERFRKQMQVSFTSKLQTLGKLLQKWEKSEGTNFDEKILSEDVHTLLSNSDDYCNWVEKRTKFMHLKTVKQKRRKRPPLIKNRARSISPSQQNDDSSVKTTLSISSEPPPSHRKVQKTPIRNTAKIRREQSPDNRSIRLPKFTVHTRSVQRPHTDRKNRLNNVNTLADSSKIRESRSVKKNRNMPNMSPQKPLSSNGHVTNIRRASPQINKTKKGSKLIINSKEQKTLMPFGLLLSRTPSQKENLEFQ